MNTWIAETFHTLEHAQTPCNPLMLKNEFKGPELLQTTVHSCWLRSTHTVQIHTFSPAIHAFFCNKFSLKGSLSQMLGLQRESLKLPANWQWDVCELPLRLTTMWNGKTCQWDPASETVITCQHVRFQRHERSLAVSCGLSPASVKVNVPALH